MYASPVQHSSPPSPKTSQLISLNALCVLDNNDDYLFGLLAKPVDFFKWIPRLWKRMLFLSICRHFIDSRKSELKWQR